MQTTFKVSRGTAAIIEGQHIDISKSGTITTEPKGVLRKCKIGDVLEFDDKRLSCFAADESTFFEDM